MSWLAGRQRALDQIEKTLPPDDYRLASLFAFFARVARDDAMPGTERVQACRADRGWPLKTETQLTATAAGSGQGQPS